MSRETLRARARRSIAIGVSISPGKIALILIPGFPFSTASNCVSALTLDLDVLYAGPEPDSGPVTVHTDAMDEMLVITHDGQ